MNEEEATYFGEQVFTTEYIDELIDDLDEDELNAYLIAVDSEYPSLNIAEGVGPDTEFFPYRLVGLSFGMGYFPGYAINVETGERLNMGFAENSFFGADNGRDMLWNPSARISSPLGQQLFLGGEHYFYVFDNNALYKDDDGEFPMYDGGKYAFDAFTDGSAGDRRKTFAGMEWVYFPLLAPGFEYKTPQEGLVPGEVVISVNVAKPYEPYATAADELGDGSLPYISTEESLELSDNQWYPMYEFSTKGSEVFVNQEVVAEESLNLIDIVPNPYYAYSSYEQSRVDNRVKFINLPPECKIQVFTVNGTLIRILEKDNPNTFLEWDLRNEAFIPVAGGIYLIHVSVPGVGDRVLKFFMATRPADLRNL